MKIPASQRDEASGRAGRQREYTPRAGEFKIDVSEMKVGDSPSEPPSGNGHSRGESPTLRRLPLRRWLAPVKPRADLRIEVDIDPHSFL